MATTTKAELGALASSFIDIVSLPWMDTAPGNQMKVLMHDPKTEMLTLITRLAPGACVPYARSPACLSDYNEPLARSDRRIAAVDEEIGACHERGLVAGQKQRTISNFFGPSQPVK